MKTEELKNVDSANMPRRSFLRYAGVGAASVGLLATAGCQKDHIKTYNGVDIGSGDTGILNYAYALEQLEAAFYSAVVANPYTGMSDHEKKLLTSIRDHEILHREFFKAALGSSAIIGLTVDFSSLDFKNRIQILATAKAFEDLGVSAYGGAGYLITNPDYLTIAGKIVSVEARHAALIREMISPGSFAGSDVVDSNGLNQSNEIKVVLPIANTFLKTKVSASNFGYKA
ncbi:ferritin-like domain-containing protein [Mucilaginibacter xinganensis]|uniref:Ferritin-like domain-containing protein n=1 Tax=Mucilaginibacter xinganensis TaxID=1234841 RepID=A0A223P023_9SPHI|nr:ferritin-like domain-containing protein [Mucilaginibacter xinganensis]ASU35436.1 Ferritin-like domain-containing protein [Mucilaginibacter xinganensis]